MGDRKHFTLIRSFHLADLFTLANAFCGMGAIFSAMAYLENRHASLLLLAAAFVPLSFLFDVLDGRIARWRHKQSLMGQELDSLADVISFGVAPACLAYAAGMQGGWDSVVLLYFVGCGVSRLARYNVTADDLTGEDGKVTHFEGTPIPTSTVLVGLVAVCAYMDRLDAALPFGSFTVGPWRLHPLVLPWALSGTLMVSKTLRIPKL